MVSICAGMAREKQAGPGMAWQSAPRQRDRAGRCLGPMTKVEPEGSVAHVERWSLFRNVKLASFSDAELDKVLPPLLR